MLKRERLRRDGNDPAAQRRSDRRGQHHLLGALEMHGRMPIQQLADRLHVSPPTVSAMVRSLSDEGLVLRERDPDDQRVVWASITEVGLAMVREERRRWREVFLERFEQLDAEDQRLIADAIPALERLVSLDHRDCAGKGA